MHILMAALTPPRLAEFGLRPTFTNLTAPMNYRKILSLLMLGFASTALAAAPPLKVLVIGAPGGGYSTFPDAALAELFSRAYGWDTRATQFYTKLDANPLYRSDLGTAEDVQREKFP